MARDAVTITDLALNDSTTVPAGTTIAPANGAVITPAGKDNLIIQVENTAASPYDVTFKAGDNPPAFQAGLGDLVEEIPASTGKEVFVLESARFMQDDGTILVDFETGMTGNIKVYRLPNGF